MNEPPPPSGHLDAHSREPPDIPTLTRAMAKGDELAYRTFYNAYFDRLLRYLLVVTHGNEDSAREALQLTLLRVVRHIKPFPTESAFWHWLTLLARNACTDESRKRRRYFAFLDRFTLHIDLHSAPSHTTAADEKLRALLDRTVELLPPDEHDMIVQKYIARHPIRQIAGNLQTTEKAVESKLSRIRRKLKHALLSALKNEPPS